MNYAPFTVQNPGTPPREHSRRRRRSATATDAMDRVRRRQRLFYEPRRDQFMHEPRRRT